MGGRASVIRHEARLRRDALRTLGLPADVWGYIVGQTPQPDDATTTCATAASQVAVAWIRRVIPDAGTNRSRWRTDPVWQLIQAAPFADAPTTARRLMRREQHVHAVEQLDAGAYGYLVSRTALLHPQGETFHVSMGLRGLFDALSKIAAQPEKDFGELVRQRRRKCGLPVVPAGKILPFLPAQRTDDREQLHAVNKAELVALQQDLPPDEICAAHMQLAEGRLAEALHALEDASLGGARVWDIVRLEQACVDELTTYAALHRQGL